MLTRTEGYSLLEALPKGGPVGPERKEKLFYYVLTSHRLRYSTLNLFNNRYG